MEKQRFRPKAAQNPAHLGHRTARMTPGCWRLLKPGRRCRNRPRPASWRWSERPEAHSELRKSALNILKKGLPAQGALAEPPKSALNILKKVLPAWRVPPPLGHGSIDGINVVLWWANDRATNTGYGPGFAHV